MTHELVVIGCGNMGGAIVRGAVNARVIAPGQIVVCDHDPGKRAPLGALGCRTIDHPSQLSPHQVTRQYLWAIKPQSFADAAALWRGHVRADEVQISIMAGLSCASISSVLGGAPVVRTMPNTPAQIGRGVTGLALGPGVMDEQAEFARRLFHAVGPCVVMIDETQIDALAAVSGCGPAYLFYLAQAMVSAGVSMGLDEPTALSITRHTLAGAGELLAGSDQSPLALRQQVTSTGGMTASAIATLDGADAQGLITRAILVARERGVELSKF